MEKIIIKKKFHLFNDYWNPKIIGSINDHDVKLAKVKGEFVWHNHENEDELFLVIKGKLIIEFQDKKVELNELKDKLSSLLGSEEDNTEEIVSLTNEIQTKMQEIGQDIYSQPQSESNSNDDSNDDSDTIEGEYKEV